MNYTPEDYQRAKPFLDRLNSVRRRMRAEDYIQLKSMALRGDLTGAMIGLRVLLKAKRGSAS